LLAFASQFTGWLPDIVTGGFHDFPHNLLENLEIDHHRFLSLFLMASVKIVFPFDTV
jgi:hypothetical protein